MGATKELTASEKLIEEIHNHVHVNSWLNITNFDNWVFVQGDSENGIGERGGMMNFPITLDCGSPENVASVLEYFKNIEAPNLEPSSEGGNFLTVFKCWI